MGSVDLVIALEQTTRAIDDLLNMYAADFCDEDRLREARNRILQNGGTLAYIAHVQKTNKEALKRHEDETNARSRGREL